jgi:hypothetical protein
MPLAAYGGSGAEDEGQPELVDAAPVTSMPTPPTIPHGSSPTTPAASAAPTPPLPAAPGSNFPVPDDEPTNEPTLLTRVVHLLRTSRVAAGAGFAVVIVVGLVVLSSGGASPSATAATPTKGPTAAATIPAPSGDASMIVSGSVTGSFPLTGLAGGQHVDATTVALGWGDAAQNTVTITGPLDRGTRATDAHLVLTISLVVNGAAATFTSDAGQCAVGMAQVGTKVQGSFNCHKLKSADGKLTIDASGSYRS